MSLSTKDPCHLPSQTREIGIRSVKSIVDTASKVIISAFSVVASAITGSLRNSRGVRTAFTNCSESQGCVSSPAIDSQLMKQTPLDIYGRFVGYDGVEGLNFYTCSLETAMCWRYVTS